MTVYTVNSGQISTGITLHSGDEIGVFNGGTAIDTTVYSDALAFVYSGGVASDTRLMSGGVIGILTGGTETSTTVNSDGEDRVLTGGTAFATTVYAGGVELLSGGTAVGANLAPIVGGFSVSGYVFHGAGTQVITAGGVASSTVIGARGTQNVENGGTAVGVTIEYSKFLVSPQDYLVIAGGVQNVMSGGTAFNTVLDGLSAIVAHDPYVGKGGGPSVQNVDAGATVVGVTLYGSSTEQNIYGGTVANVNVGYHGVQNIHAGTISNVSIYTYGVETIDGGDLQGVSIGLDGVQVIRGGTVTNVSGYGGKQEISGGLVTNVTLTQGAQTIYGHASATNVVLSDGADQYDLGVTAGVTLTASDQYVGLYLVLNPEAYGAPVASATDTVINAKGVQFLGNQQYTSGFASNTTINSGGQQRVGAPDGREQPARGGAFYFSSGGQGTALNTTINSGGQQLVFENGTASSTGIYNGGRQTVYGGVAIGTTIHAGGLQLVDYGKALGITNSSTYGIYGGQAFDTVIDSGGVQYVAVLRNDAVETATSTLILDGGSQRVGGYLGAVGIANFTTIDSGGIQVLGAPTTVRQSDTFAGGTGFASNTTIDGGTQYVGVSGGAGFATNTAVYHGGEEIVRVSGTATATAIFAGGVADVTSGGTMFAPVVNGGSAIISGTIGGTIDFSDTAGGILSIASTADVLGSTGVTDFVPGDTIDLGGASTLVFDTATGTLSTDNGIVLDVSLATGETLVSTAISGGLEVTALAEQCFVVGTSIRTPEGDVLVERLKVGDQILTQQSKSRSIIWIGEGRVLVTRGRRTAATPIIVRKDALAENVPFHDLRVTKGHSFYFDGALVPVEFLVNHRSILWDDHALEVHLFHVELESHDVLLANGAPAESYRDDGNRWLFRNANTGWGLPPLDPCAPILTGGPIVDAIWRRLLERAGYRSGLPLTDDPDLHLLVDGRRLDPVSRSRSPSGVKYSFRLPVRAVSVRVVSRSGSPAEFGLMRDPRQLGVALRRVTGLQDSRLCVIEAADARLTDGFHLYEADNDFRWTDGDARLPVEILMPSDGPAELVLYVGCTSDYLDTGSAVRAA